MQTNEMTIPAVLRTRLMLDRVEVSWPSGLKQGFEKLPADHIYKIIEGESSVRPFIAATTISNGTCLSALSTITLLGST